MKENPRAVRLAERIQQIVATLLEGRIKDPRLGFVTVTDVKVTGDCQHASVYYTVLGDDEDRKSTAAALAKARGLIRSEVGKQTGLRLTPTIEFHLDEIPEGAQQLNEVLAQARRQDEELARLRATATPAGDADPYKRPANRDDDEPESDATL